MKLPRLPMGCLSSRSSVTPSDRIVEPNGGPNKQLQPTAQQANGNSFIGSNINNNKLNIGNSSISNNINSRDTSSRQKIANMTDDRGGHGGNQSSSYMSSNSDRRPSLKKKSISHENSMGSSVETADDDIVSLLMEDKRSGAGGGHSTGHKSKHLKSDEGGQHEGQHNAASSNRRDRRRNLDTNNNNNSLNGDDEIGSTGVDEEDEDEEEEEEEEEGNNSMPSKRNEGSFDEEPNMELLRQYVAVDYEISQLEDKDALRVYHEKIEQLEQLERELDMISSEVEEVAGRSTDDADMSRVPSATGDGPNNMDSRTDLESNSMISGLSGNTSQRSWMYNGNENNNNNNSNQNNSSRNNANSKSNNKASLKTNSTIVKGGGKGTSATGSQVKERGAARSYAGSSHQGGLTSANQMSYSTVEEVFNRKIILEKERDKLKKEVEIVILDCDKLQQRYKKRDEILDKLFDGRTGNGLENHLEQQLNWLLEQKHYVDQVFFAWKRAETLTSQTCEQFASALEMLKKLPKIEAAEEKAELAKSIERLLLKSRQDMEQAQKYNPNVDAPFFTDNETERFDKIIKTIQSEQINPSDYSQILTVIQFAYKRAVSIRLWLEQILQTTIARDSFELAEEYKWIAIQLRKERINLIKSKLQDSPYRSMARSVQEQMARQQSISERKQQQQQQQHEVNRDSGIESEPNDLDIEEEIYRVLEMNKSRLESMSGATAGAAGAATNMIDQSLMMKNSAMNVQQQQQQQQLKVGLQNGPTAIGSASGSSESNQRDQMMQERVQRRVKGGQQLHLDQVEPPVLPSNHEFAGAGASVSASAASNGGSTGNNSAATNHDGYRLPGASATPTKLKVELDEEARQSLLKQVDQIHVRHKDRMERLRGNNRAKATEFITSKMQKVRQSASSTADSERQQEQE